jgi:hypothetical protein
MELNFSEIDRNSHESFDYNNEPVQNSDKYWENYNENEKGKKKKVSFNDILTNMNLVVNKNGVLQQMVPSQNYIEHQQNYDHQIPDNTNYYPTNNTNYYPTNNTNYYPTNPVQQKQRINNTPIDNSVKHSVIYNKYFKDYVDALPSEPEVRVPKTIEEYHQMLLEDKLKLIEERKRVSQIKPTKLLFTTSGINNTNGQTNIRPTNNTLRMMRFK